MLREGNAEPESDEDYEFDEEEGDLGSDEDVDSEEDGELDDEDEEVSSRPHLYNVINECTIISNRTIKLVKKAL